MDLDYFTSAPEPRDPPNPVQLPQPVRWRWLQPSRQPLLPWDALFDVVEWGSRAINVFKIWSN